MPNLNKTDMTPQTIFGMNVDLFQNDIGFPKWWWSIIAAALLMSLTMTGWFLFKNYGNGRICEWQTWKRRESQKQEKV